ncbi:MAG: TonB-dependent receptor [Terracidiphilus sp.]
MLNLFREIPWLIVPLLVLSFTVARAQQLTGTISGTAADPTDARIPGATVTIVNDATGDKRDTKADSAGFFSVTALPPGTYTVTVSSKGFASWRETGISLSQGDSRTIPSIHLKISSDATAVTVISGQDAEVPVDNAEISSTLNNELVDSAVLTGRNAAELIKMMPGVVFNNFGGSGSAYNSQVTGTNNGPAGSFSANGTQPYGSTDVYLDGANLIDPGNAGTQVANINQDMTDSIKYLSASYGAEFAKGPAVLQAFSKSGGQKFHGEAYLYARNTGIGYANDWNNKFQQESGAAGKPGATPASIAASNALTPQSFYYVGGNVGGPIFFPHFNKNRDKLFFWGGYEKMIQHPYNAPVNINVPTSSLSSTTKGIPGQLDGDFTNTGVVAGAITQNQTAYNVPCLNGGNGCDTLNSPWKGQTTGLKNYFDKAGVAATSLIPLANEIPNAANGWSNYVFSPALPQDRWEATGKVTYAFNDNNKLWGTYAYQSETDDHPLSIWWAPAYTVPYPSNPVGKETAHVYLANFTHIFNASSTNEFVFAYSEFVNSNTESNPSAVSDAKLGFPSESIFGSSHAVDQIPNFFDSWGGGQTAAIGEMSFNGGIYGKNSFGKTSKAPSIADTFTKIIRTHSVKAGFYWDTQENLQADSNNFGGGGAWAEYDVSPWGGNNTNNLVLDRLLGRNNQYSEQSTEPVPDILWHQWSLWAQDSWKTSRKLTINVGLRADHMGQWYDKIGGTQVWDPASYDNSKNAAANTGLLWHATNSAIPESGWASKLFFYDPRVGAAYDVFGTGKTVVRAGFGTYKYQVSSNDSSGAMNGPLGSFNYATPSSFYGYHVNGGVVNADQFGTLPQLKFNIPSGLNQNGSSPVADKRGDDQVPYANTYSLGVAQALPGHTVAEFSYVGSMSRDQLLNGTSQLNDPNPVAYGAMFGPDPVLGHLVNPQPVHCPSDQTCPTGPPAIVANDYRPLSNYSIIKLYQHGGYANYNSLQVSAQKQSGNLFIFSNFTFGKVLGTRDGSTANGNGNGNVLNPFNLASNYGPLAYDHTKVFNVSFSYKLPNFIHGNALLAAPVNGWQFSGYTTYQDGANLQASNPVLNATYNGNWYDEAKNKTGQQPITLPNGLKSEGLQQQEWFGTSEYPNALIPLLTCNPAKGLHKGQQFNPNCFASPLPPTATTVGQQGPNIWPYLRNPHYWGSDLAVFKAFKVTEAQRIEARISATNWLNHPNGAFNLSGSNSDDKLIFNGYSSSSGMITNSNTSTTGTPAAKVGYRWIQFAAKYYF